MKKLCSFLIVAVGTAVATGASTACIWMIFDEPTAPKALIK